MLYYNHKKSSNTKVWSLILKLICKCFDKIIKNDNNKIAIFQINQFSLF